jgi:RNA polymerase sigma factor (sigma-70 family)
LAGETLGEALRRLGRFGGLQGDLAQTDAQLLERFARRRDESAFAALVARHGPMVLGVCRRLLHDANDADDAFQAVFLVLARKAGAIPRQTLLGPWLYGVAWRVALRLRGRALRRRMHERTGVDLETAPADDAAWSEVRPLVHEEVRRLPDKYRDVVVLCCLEEKSNEEAAALLRRPVGTVKSRLARARELLRSRLSRRGITLSAVLLTGALAVRPKQATTAPLESVVMVVAPFAAGGRLGAGVGGRAAGLARGVLRSEAVTRFTVAAAAVVLAACILGVVAWVVQSGPGPAVVAARTDAEAIQGDWQITGLDQTGLGEQLDDAQVQALVAMKWRFKGDQLVVLLGENGERTSVYKMDPNSDPKAIDVDWGGGVCLSVYSLDGDQLVIHMCNPATQVRPDGLTPRKGDGTMTFTFLRE